MSDYYDEEGGTNIYGWMIFVSTGLLVLAIILKVMQQNMYAAG